MSGIRIRQSGMALAAVHSVGSAAIADGAVTNAKLADMAESSFKGRYHPIAIHLLGDSTVADYPPEQAPQTGWGQAIASYFDPELGVVANHAVSGRSSVTFYASDWPAVRAALQPSDYVLIQFGHNDVGTKAAFKAQIQLYVDESRAAQAVPLLVTPPERNQWSGGHIVPSHDDYPDAVRELAAEESVELVDLTALSVELYESFGEEATTDTIFMPADITHFQETGAERLAELIVADAGSRSLGLAAYLLPD